MIDIIMNSPFFLDNWVKTLKLLTSYSLYNSISTAACTKIYIHKSV